MYKARRGGRVHTIMSSAATHDIAPVAGAYEYADTGSAALVRHSMNMIDRELLRQKGEMRRKVLEECRKALKQALAYEVAPLPLDYHLREALGWAVHGKLLSTAQAQMLGDACEQVHKNVYFAEVKGFPLDMVYEVRLSIINFANRLRDAINEHVGDLQV